MTIEQKVDNMKTMMGDDVANVSDDELIVYLNLAQQKLINHIYPFKDDVVEIPSKYDYQLIELAIVLFNLRGVEGQETHNENGVHRKYRTEAQILASIPKYAGLPL